MGLYVNPLTETKEAFLLREGTPIRKPDEFVKDEAAVPVCWIDNYSFTAAIVVYGPRELRRTAITDGRDSRWYTVPLENLIPVVRGFGGVQDRTTDVAAAFAGGDDW